MTQSIHVDHQGSVKMARLDSKDLYEYSDQNPDINLSLQWTLSKIL